jgi:hypothetical protein
VIAVGLIHSGKLRHPVLTSANWKPEYFVPRFIADCARLREFSGIQFRSPKHYEENLVVFNPGVRFVERIGEAELFELKDKHQSGDSDF